MMTLGALTVILLFAVVTIVLLSVQYDISHGITDFSTQTMCLAVYRVRGAMSGGYGLMGFGWRKITDSIVPDNPACGKIVVVNPNQKNPHIANVTSSEKVSRKIAAEIHTCWGKAEQDWGGTLSSTTIQCVYSLKFKLNDTTKYVDECTITEALGNENNPQYKTTWQAESTPGNTECVCSACKDGASARANNCATLAPGGDHIVSDLPTCFNKPNKEYVLRIYYEGQGEDNRKIIIKEIT